VGFDPVKDGRGIKKKTVDIAWHKSKGSDNIKRGEKIRKEEMRIAQRMHLSES
jgi:hypothetical protein